MKALVQYTVWRLALFFIPFLIMVAAQVPVWLAGLIALVFAFCASYLFLRDQRRAFSEELAKARRGEKPPDSDADLEDAVVDAENESTTETDASSKP